jgi:hypothetical protein
MATNFVNNRNLPDLFTYTKALREDILYNRLNCVRVGIVEEFNSEDLTVKVKIANQFVTKFDEVGNPIAQDYPVLTAKVWFMGSPTYGITCPLRMGDEGLILFCDREIESWYLTGQAISPQYFRAHDITDAIFITGLHSVVKPLAYVPDCLNLWYGDTSMQIRESGITVNGSITATGDIVAGNISLQNHVHPTTTEGADTGVPKG